MKVINVPTGKIIIINGDKGLLECLSIGDYGKEKNIKADFLGQTNDINGVPNGQIMPLEEKWVITISTQYGCSMGCSFCDVPKVGKGINASVDDLIRQVQVGLECYPNVKTTKRLNLHFARMGEPTFNPYVLKFTREYLRKIVKSYLGNVLIHPVISTMLPKNNINLFRFLQDWCEIKNHMFRGDAGLQLSINSTDDKERNEMFNNNSISFDKLKAIADSLPMPVGRKYALNFALAGYTINAEQLKETFHPSKFMCKITPMHETNACVNNNIHTEKGYVSYTPYKEVEQNLKDVGYDVLVFIPSIEEDESRITCGNAILSLEG